MVKYLPDYYKILKIETTANKKTIKKAYKNLSQKYDPKYNNKSDAKKMFKLINDAYIVLSDDEKRRKYDIIRQKAIKNKDKDKKTINAKESIELAKDMKDKYDLISKLFKVGSGSVKGKALFSGTNIIIGGVMAGYGVKKGRDYIAKRGQRKAE